MSISNPPTMLLRLQLPLQMQLPPSDNTYRVLLQIYNICGCNYHPTRPAAAGKLAKVITNNVIGIHFLETLSVKTRRWMSPHHPAEIHMWKMSGDWNLSSEWGHTGHTVCKWTRILMHLCSLTGSTQSICGACNAFRGSSHQLRPLPPPSISGRPLPSPPTTPNSRLPP